MRLSNLFRQRKLLAIVVGLALLTTVVTAVVIIRQNTPVVTVDSPQANCATLTVSPPSVPVGSSGFVTFFCKDTNNNPTPAIHVPAGAKVSSSFALPSPYTDLAIYPSNASVGTGQVCSTSINGVQNLTSGVVVAFPHGFDTNWNYCSDYSNAPPGSLPPFTIAWGTGGLSNNQSTVVRFDFPSPCHSYAESRHTGSPNSIEFWIYIEAGNTHDLEGWAYFVPDGAIILTFDIGVAQAPPSGTQNGSLMFFVTHAGLEWPSDTSMTLFCK